MTSLLSILPHAFRRRGLWIAFTLLLRTLLNLAGLAVLLSVLVLLLDPASLEGSGPLARAYTLMGFSSPSHFVFAVCGAVVAVILLKCLLNLWLARIEHHYIYDLYRTLSRQLYVTYRNNGLQFVKGAHSSVLARNVNVVCFAFTTGVLKPVATIAAEVMLLILLLAALAFYAPLAALLSIVVFLPAGWLYYRLVRNRIDRYGELENKAQREKSRLVSETFRGYADIEINGAFPSMLRAFDRAMDRVVHIRAREATLGMLPQILTEVGLAAGMALLVVLSLGTDAGQMRLAFGIFAVAALRLMPSVRNILTGWATIRFNRYTIGILQEATVSSRTEDPAPASTDKLPFRHEIAVRDLSFRFPDDNRDLFHGLTLSFHKGERIGIRGRSGAGKTTLFNLLLGLYAPTGGSIEVDGTPLTAANRRAWQNRVGYVSQALFIADGSFVANVALGVPEEEIDRERVAQVLETAQLGDLIASLPSGMDTHVGECGGRLSGGQRQRIGIARALYRRADVLFFDEATSALDSGTEEEINHAIDRISREHAGLTILMIAHREASLSGCNRIITLGE